jgi:abortive infection bacteriophage resistance protein
VSTVAEAIREELMAKNEEYRRLREQHTTYASQLNLLASKNFLTEDEKVEEVRLKKLKLRAKDQMEMLVRQSQVVH